MVFDRERELPTEREREREMLPMMEGFVEGDRFDNYQSAIGKKPPS